MGISEKEVVVALDKLKQPPYSLNEAMRLIHQDKIDREQSGFKNEMQETTGKFRPVPGLRIC
jgi:hypothetical protein